MTRTPPSRCSCSRGPASWALAGVLLASTSAVAGGFHISILGVRRTGMMTNLASPDDVTALFHNPAGLADLGGTRLHLSSGLSFINTSLSLKELDPALYPDINPTPCGQPGEAACPWPVNADGYYEANIKPEKYLGVIPYLGVSQDLGVVAPSLRKLVASLALYAPGAYGAALPKEAPTSYLVIDGLFVVAAATAGLGYRINDMIAVGANASFNYMRLGYAQRLSTIDALTPRGQAPDLTAGLAQAALGDLRMDYTGTDNGAGWGLGALLTPLSWLSMGFDYEGATKARFRGPVTIRGLGSKVTGSHATSSSNLAKVVQGFGYKLPTELMVEMPIPPAVGAGVTLKPSSHVEIGVDLRLWLYKLFKKQTIIPVYDPQQPGVEPLTRKGLSHDKDYSNSYEVAVGALVRPLADQDLDVMAGIGFDKSPVPNKTLSIDNPSMNQFIVSAGIRGTVFERWRIGAAYMLINYLERDVRNSETWPPTNVRISGRSHIPTLEVEYVF